MPADQFKGDVTLADLGIDSLVTTEIVSEVDQVFSISIPQDQLQDLQTFASLSAYLAGRLGREQQDTPTVVQTTASSEQRQTQPSASSLEAAPTAPERGRPRDSENLLPKLASLLASHLECSPADFERSTNLADRGLDSLLCIELMSDIEKTFGVSVDLAQLTSESTFGDLAGMFVKVTGRKNRRLQRQDLRPLRRAHRQSPLKPAVQRTCPGVSSTRQGAHAAEPLRCRAGEAD